MKIEETKQKVSELREYLDFITEIGHKYGFSDSIRESIKNTGEELKLIENINTMRSQDFSRFASGDFGFI